MLSIKDVDTSKFTFNPADDDFVEKVEASGEIFKKDIPNVNKKKLFGYLVLMYDPNSELRRTISVLPHRKMMAALAAGFALNPKTNKFSDEVENALSGANMDVNRMAAELEVIIGGLDILAHSAYTRIFIELVAASNNKDKAKDLVPLIAKVRNEIDILEKKILGGDEVSLMKKALYLSSRKVGLNIRMEDIVERLEKGDDLADFNEYPDNYRPQKLTYAGEGSSQDN